MKSLQLLSVRQTPTIRRIKPRFEFGLRLIPETILKVYSMTTFQGVHYCISHVICPKVVAVASEKWTTKTRPNGGAYPS